MARLFLDANYFIDAVERQPNKGILKTLIGHTSFISGLSVAIYSYLFKIKVPNKQFLIQLEEFQLVDLTQNIFQNALLGPTADFEDNVQLQSAAEGDCEYFLTSDKNLLRLGIFGKTRVVSSFGG